MNLTRRNFFEGVAAAGAMAALAGCSAGTSGSSGSGTEGGFKVPDASSYPIAPDGSSVTAKWSQETIGESRSGEGFTKVTNEDGGPSLAFMPDTNVSIIQVDGYAFKDLNGNGKLDLYEDWRQSDEDRAKALSDSMELEDIYPLMFYTSFFESGMPLGDQTISILTEGARTTCNNSGYGPEDTTEAVKWNNAVQEQCEKLGGYGIPHMAAFDPFFKYGIPGNMSVAATFDPELAHKAGESMAKVWRALGLHVYYGPQIGITTDPRWVRLSGGFTEDPALDRDLAQNYVDGLQSTYDESGEDEGWGSESIICQTKHYPGGGAAEGGRYDHSDTGKYNVYPGDNFRAHFIPWADGIYSLPGKTKCSGSTMPDYNIFYSEDKEYGENVGVGFDEYKMGILRDLIGDNLVSSDWDITSNFDTPGQLREGGSNHAWGVESLTPAEREAKALEAGGLDQFGGEFEVAIAQQAHDIMVDDIGKDKADARFHDSARRVFVAMNRLGLFENPYLEQAATDAAVSDSDVAAIGEEISQKSVVMLKNSGSVVKKRSAKPTVYIPRAFKAAADSMGWGGKSMHTPASWDAVVDLDLAGEYFEVVTDTLGDPTGDPDSETGTASYTEADCTKATAEQLSACDFAFTKLASPSSGQGYDEKTKTYLPISLQYRTYTADGANVRKTSLAGNTLADGTIENRSYFGQSATASNESELDGLLALKASLPEGVPLVASFSLNNPMVFAEVEPTCDAMFATFADLDDKYVLAAAAGQYEPTGLLPLQMPEDMDAVEAQYEDVPRDMDCYIDSAKNIYDFGFGLNWSGVIDDERTKKYCVEPLTAPTASVSF